MTSSSPPARPVSRRERPAKPALTREGIIDTAVRLMGTEGLGRVTMRRLAHELDTGPASLYVYVRNVAELHGAILDQLLAQAPPPARARQWTVRVERTLLAYAAILFEHPGLARSALTLRPGGEHYFGLIETLLADMADGGVPADRAAWGVDVLLQLVTATAAEQTTRDESADAPAEQAAQLTALEQGAADRFPRLRALAGEIVSGDGMDRFRWAIQALLAGIAVTPRPEASRQRRTGGSVWVFAPAVLLLGAGMGLCFASIYDVAVGDVAREEAGGASGSLSAVQQLASAIGAALVTTVYFGHLSTGATQAMAISVAAVGAIVVACLGLVWLMPRNAPPENDTPPA
jgi:AcrR family transcriptional regulator